MQTLTSFEEHLKCFNGGLGFLTIINLYLLMDSLNDSMYDEQAEEEQYLLGGRNLLGPQKAKSVKTLMIVAVLGFLAACLISSLVLSSTFLSSSSPSVGNSESIYQKMKALIESKTLSISIHREYDDDNMMTYPFLQNGFLMEPFRVNTVKVGGFVSNDGCSVDWVMRSDVTSLQAGEVIFEGQVESLNNTFTVIPTATGKYSLQFKQSCANKWPSSEGILTSDGRGFKSSSNFTVWVKYVRRELMTLTDADREEFLDAFGILWKVNTLEGQQRYGAKYKSAQYFAMIHNDAAGNGVCDEFHGGLGFVSNHVYLTSFLEQSLQLVNPRVALHYMDYSKYFESDAFRTGHLSNTLDGGAWTEIMTAKWFGSNDPITGRIVDGRWRNLLVPAVDDEFYRTQGVNKSQLFFPAEADRWLSVQSAHMQSTTGLLRARWNLNPVNYTIRFNNVDRIVDARQLSAVSYDKYRGVSCENYYDFMQNSVINKSFETFLGNMEGRVHGPIHFTFGGAGGEKYHRNDDIFRTRFNFSDGDLAFLTQLSHTYMKSEAPKWWTGGKQRLNWNCTFPVPISTDVNEMLNLQAQLGGGQAGGLNWPGEAHGTYCDANEYYYQSDATLNEFIDLFFEPLAAASAELSDKFRALPLRDKRDVVKLLNTRYQFDGDIATSSAALDPLFWVQHGAAERLFQRILFENVLLDKAFTTLDKCSGHSADSVKYWLTGFTLEDPALRAETLTNAQLTEILDPTGELYRDNVNFVYDTSSFGFCSQFEALF